MYKILLPESGEKAYQTAALAFQEMYEKVTGARLPLITEDDGLSDLIVIGSDAVNDFAAQAFACGWIDSFGIRYGTDDYAIRSVERDGRAFLFLAGGRGRSTLYAVYDYFERAAGCHYYWDGDVIPHRGELSIRGLSVTEQPRFEYRGLRYFAHRGLHRYQAEHWSLEDWQREIDWMVKRRLNYFMLRIGIDDLYQRAFPDVVSYPNATERLPEATAEGYDDRTLFWSLEYRGILRQKLLAYAFDRDLIHSEDCGTMTHWYSRTPIEYLEKKQPRLLAQASSGYSEQTGLCWDPRVKENLDNYFRLTETYVEQYGRPELFHTIGLAERLIFDDRKQNMNMKLLTYRRILQRVHERYPLAKTLIASWDFIGWWYPEEVQQLMREFDPERTIILDYTSDHDDPDRCFPNWGLVGKFPWIFGIFHAYEAQNCLRGMYDTTKERLEIARDDPFCKGLIYWPELSHSDPLVLEYLVENAWKPEQLTIEPLAERFSLARYSQFGEQMNRAWQAYLPLIKLVSWGHYSRRTPDDPDYVKYCHGWSDHRSTLVDVFSGWEMFALEETEQNTSWVAGEHKSRLAANRARWEYLLGQAKPYRENISATLQALYTLPDEALDNPFVRRDLMDLAHSLLEQIAHYGMLRMALWRAQFQAGEDVGERILAQCDAIYATSEILGRLLTCHEDYSMNATMDGLKRVSPVNPVFEPTLKHNLVNGYCRQAACEPWNYLYLPEQRLYFDWVKENVRANNRGEWVRVPEETRRALYQAFMDKPLDEMRPVPGDLKALLRQAEAAVLRVEV